jgi:hypothetical protein
MRACLRPSKKCGWAERGQGTFEYILIVLIMVILILSLLYQFHSSFRIYAEAFFDGYVRCLLEVGELPGTGSVCSQSYTAFDPKSGKALLKDNIPDGGGGSGGGGGGKNGAKNGAKKPSTKGGETLARGGGGGGGGGSGSRGRSGGFQSHSEPIGTIGGSDDSSSSDKSSSPGASSRTRSIGQVAGKGSASSFVMETASESSVDDGRPAAKSTGKKKTAGNEGLKPVKSTEKIDRKPAKVMEDDTQGFSVGGFIRLLFIILIVVAMVVFFGGQLLQISKSREKGGD